MVHEIRLPVLGEKIESGDVVSIKIAVGEAFEATQTFLEVETDKAVIEVPCGVTGVLTELKIAVGQKIKVGQVLALVELADSQQKKPPVEKQTQTTEPKFFQPEKQPVASPLVEPSPPQIKKTLAEDSVVAHPVLSESVSGEILASPSIRALARQLGVDLGLIKGSGAHGRITREDVHQFVSKKINLAEDSPKPEVESPFLKDDLPDFTKWGEVEVLPMSGVRRATAKAMSLSWSQIPHVTQFDEADITKIMKLRDRFAKRVVEAGGKLTVTAIILKVTAAALKVFPQFNSSVDSVHETVIHKKYFHLGVAVDTDRGLIVPVIRNVDKKNIIELSADLTKSADAARAHKTSLEEMQGATFTITNLGSLGTTHFTPLINWPQVAILGLGRASERPVFRGDQWERRLILPLSLSYDHRVIDGADAARFLRWIAEAVQEPFLMDLEG